MGTDGLPGSLKFMPFGNLPVASMVLLREAVLPAHSLWIVAYSSLERRLSPNDHYTPV